MPLFHFLAASSWAVLAVVPTQAQVQAAQAGQPIQQSTNAEPVPIVDSVEAVDPALQQAVEQALDAGNQPVQWQQPDYVLPAEPTPDRFLQDNADLFETLPKIEEDEAQAPIDFGEPVALDPVVTFDNSLLVDLQPMPLNEDVVPVNFEIEEAAIRGLKYKVSVAGAPSEAAIEAEFKRLSALSKGQGDEATPAQLISRINADKLLMTKLLEAEGWYSGDVQSELSGVRTGQADVKFEVTPGTRYTWNEIELDLIPNGKEALKEGFALKSGDPIRAIEVDAAEGALLLKLQESGYPFAEIGARDVVLDDNKATGNYLLTGDIGSRGVFGRIYLCRRPANPLPVTGQAEAGQTECDQEGLPFDSEHAAVIARFRSGDLYDTRMLDDFRRALIATQQFSGLTVSTVNTHKLTDQVNITKANAGSVEAGETFVVTDIRVEGERGPQKRLTGQLGYSTEEGIRTEGAWQHRSFIVPEGNLLTRAVLGTEEQRLATQLSLTNWRKRDRTLAFDFDIANMTPVAYKAQTIDIGVLLSRLSTPIWQKRWTWSLGLTLGASREEARALGEPRPVPGTPGLDNINANNEPRNFLFLSMPTYLGYDRSDDLLNPTKGFKIALNATPELSREGKNLESYGRIFVETIGYQRIGQKFVLAGRLKGGTIMGADLDSIAPTRRLYAGGGGSVRGYEYQGVGLLDERDRPIGGRGLLEASIEGRYRMGDLGFVGFVDAGSVSASSTPTLNGMRYGVGVGARYYTSMGPIRVDIARAINKTSRDPAVALYISIGQAF